MTEPKSGADLRDDPLLRDVPEMEGFKILEPCVVYAKLGEGGMGAVYRGRHVNLDIDVAVKCLKRSLADESSSFITRFQREARIAANIHHQNLVQVYDIREKGGVHYLVMEYVKGETARERVVRKGPLAEAEACKIMIGAASGLAEAHSQKIVHRDIKPDNILISFEGKVKVSDLGLAKALGGEERVSMTIGVMGTPQYMAPEQWEESAAVGPSADVWSLGATMYFLLSGEHAIPSGTFQQVCKRICTEPFPDIRVRVPGVSADVARIIERCTHQDPLQRYVDCRELVRELQKVLAHDATDLADAEASKAQFQEPLLSPPPAESIARIKVAIQGDLDQTMVPGNRGGAARPVRTPAKVATPAPTAAADHTMTPGMMESPLAPTRTRSRWLVPAASVALAVLVAWGGWKVFAGEPEPDAPPIGPGPVVPTPDPEPLPPPPYNPIETFDAFEEDGLYKVVGSFSDRSIDTVYLGAKGGELFAVPVDEGGKFSWDFSPAEDGLYELTLEIRDSGTWRPNESLPVRVDRADPSVQITTPLPSRTRSAPTRLVITATDANGIASVEVSVNGSAPIAAIGAGAGGNQWHALLDAALFRFDVNYQLEVIATDTCDRQGRALIEFELDRVPPETPEVTPDTGTTLTDPRPTIRLVFKDPVWKVAFPDYSGNWTPGEDGRSFEITPELRAGRLSFVLKWSAEDDCGNSSEGSFKWAVLSGGETSKITFQESKPTKEHTATFDFMVAVPNTPLVTRESAPPPSATADAVERPVVSVEPIAGIDGGWRAGPIELAEGLNTFKVSAVDVWGRAAEDYYYVEADWTVPAVLSVAPSTGEVLKGTQREVVIEFNEPVSDVKVDDEVPTLLGNKKVRATLHWGKGAEQVSVKWSCQDTAGNVGESQLVWSVSTSALPIFEVDTKLIRPDDTDAPWGLPSGFNWKLVDPSKKTDLAAVLEVTGPYDDQSRMVLVPAGSYGEVEITTPYLIDLEEVSAARFTRVANAARTSGLSAENMRLERERESVAGVGWADAELFASLTRRSLPTVSQWVAAAAGTRDGTALRSFSWGPTFDLTRIEPVPMNAFVRLDDLVRDVSGLGVRGMGTGMLEWCVVEHGERRGVLLGGTSMIVLRPGQTLEEKHRKEKQFESRFIVHPVSDAALNGPPGGQFIRAAGLRTVIELEKKD